MGSAKTFFLMQEKVFTVNSLGLLYYIYLIKGSFLKSLKEPGI